jgi:hypothetical protein
MGDNDDNDDDVDDADNTVESSMGGDAVDKEDLVEGEVEEENHIRLLISSV